MTLIRPIIQTKQVKELPKGTYRSKSFPLIKVIVQPKETKIKIETITESPTEWKNRYMKSKKPYSDPEKQQIKQPIYLKTREIKLIQIQEITSILTQSVYLVSRALELRFLSMTFSMIMVPIMRRGNQQKFPCSSQPQSLPLFLTYNQRMSLESLLKQSLIKLLLQSFNIKWQVSVLGILKVCKKPKSYLFSGFKIAENMVELGEFYYQVTLYGTASVVSYLLHFINCSAFQSLSGTATNQRPYVLEVYPSFVYIFILSLTCAQPCPSFILSKKVQPLFLLNVGNVNYYLKSLSLVKVKIKAKITMIKSFFMLQ